MERSIYNSVDIESKSVEVIFWDKLNFRNTQLMVAEVILSHLDPGTKYLIKSEAVNSAGLGEHGSIHAFSSPEIGNYSIFITKINIFSFFRYQRRTTIIC